MARRDFIFYVAALLLLQQTINVSALLDVTNMAAGLGRQLINEVERKETYRSAADVNNKIKLISHYLQQFRDKYQEAEGYYTDYFTEELKNTATAEKYKRSILVEFDVVRKYEEYLNDYVIYNSLRRFPEKSMVEQTTISSLNSSTSKLTFQQGLKYINYILTDGYPHDNSSFVKLLISDKAISRCTMQSRQQLLYNILKHTASIDAIGYFLVQLNFAALRVYRQGYEVLDSKKNTEINNIIITIQSHDTLTAMKDFEIEFIARSRTTLNIFKDEMANPRVSRQVWNCNATFNASEEGTAFTKLDNVFQEYIINEVDMNKEDSCKAECSDYTEAKAYGCFDKTICAKQRKCDGTLWACDKKLGTTTVCLSNNNATTRYSFIAKGDQLYGHKETCPTRNLIEARSWRRLFVKCTYCMCTCDNSNIMGDRHFNLRPVMSDTEKNFIVTNARFRKVNNIVHIQIQQAKLENGGRVNKSTTVWKEVASYEITDKDVENGRDYHTITWYRRTVALDVLDSPVHNVLTGLKFSTIEGRLKLEIRATPFDFATGKLFTDRSYWYSNNDFNNRTELEVTDKTSIDLNSEQYVKFTSSSLKIDAGQSTVPYMDLTEIPSFPLVPLSGAGIYHKSTKGVGNFLSLQLLTYNYYPHIVV